MSKILAIDIGPEFSAYCRLDSGNLIRGHNWFGNDAMLTYVREEHGRGSIAVIESPQAQDRPLGKLLRDTIWWAGRFAEALDSTGVEWHEAEERDVALWLTGNRSASNPAILQGLKDVFGDKTKQPCGECGSAGSVRGSRGLKKCPACKGNKFLTLPGPLAGMNEHERSALAAAWWYWKKHLEQRAVRA